MLLTAHTPLSLESRIGASRRYAPSMRAMRTKTPTFTVRVGDDAVTATRYRPSQRIQARATLILAHGAGAGQRHPFMVRFATELAARGLDVVTFDFLYTEHGRKIPDRNPSLEACWRAIVAAVRKKTKLPLFIGGKSMGGRIASQIAATEPGSRAGSHGPTLSLTTRAATAFAGLVFLGYPLHPPGQPQKLRSAHLPDVAAPMLFCQGERDAFGTPAELKPIVKTLHAGSALVVVDGGDHSFAVPKRLGVPQDIVYARVLDAIAAWIGRVIA